MKDKILELRSQGKTYNQIQKELGCSKGTISFHCGKNQKEKSKSRLRKLRCKQHPYLSKISNFIEIHTSCIINTNKHDFKKVIFFKILRFSKSHKDKSYMKPEFTVEDVINKFGEKPKCYLTGMDIDISNTKSYHFDHKIPRSKGGDNSLDNLGICTREANQAKNNMTEKEFIELCKSVLIHKGYKLKEPQQEIES